MADKRSRFLPRRDDPRLRNFLGNVPNISWMGQQPAYDQDFWEAQQDAYEDEIIQGAMAIDPSSHTYDIDIQDYLGNIKDQEVLRQSPRIQQAIKSLGARYQRKQQGVQTAAQMAKAGIDPDTIASMMDENGYIDPVRANFLVGKAERGEKTASKAMLSEKAASDLAQARFEAMRNPTDEEKTMAFAAKYGEGKTPSTELEWAEADMMVRGPKQAIYESLVDGFDRAGYGVDRFREKQVITPQGTATTATATASAPAASGVPAQSYAERVAQIKSQPSAKSQEQRLNEMAASKGLTPLPDQRSPIAKMKDAVIGRMDRDAAEFEQIVTAPIRGLRPLQDSLGESIYNAFLNPNPETIPEENLSPQPAY